MHAALKEIMHTRSKPASLLPEIMPACAERLGADGRASSASRDPLPNGKLVCEDAGQVKVFVKAAASICCALRSAAALN